MITPVYWTPQCTHDIPQCTEHPTVLMISPTLIMVSPWCTHDIPPVYWTPSGLLTVSPNVLMITPWCIEHPPVYSLYSPLYSWYPPLYWTSPDVLHISQCTAHPMAAQHYAGWSWDPFLSTDMPSRALIDPGIIYAKIVFRRRRGAYQREGVH